MTAGKSDNLFGAGSSMFIFQYILHVNKDFNIYKNIY